MSNYERDIRPTLDLIYSAASQGDFTTAMTGMDNPGLHSLRVPFETMRIADVQGNKTAAEACIEKILADTSSTDKKGSTSLKISFLAEVAKEQTNHPELYNADEVATTLAKAIDIFADSDINTNDYLYGQQEGVHSPAIRMTNSGVPYGVNSAIDVCHALSQIGGATIHFARERVTSETPPDTLTPLTSRITTMVRPSYALQDQHPIFAQMAQYIQAMRLHGMQGVNRQTYVENLGEVILQQLIMQYANNPELSYIATEAQEALTNPSATMELAPEVKKLS